MIEMYQKAGQIVKDVRELAVSEVHEGMKVLDLTNRIESEIMKRGGFPAFPCNISINEVTAHYTSPPGDETILKDGDLVKIDLGAHVDGFIADSATTVMIGSGEGPYTGGDKYYTPEKQLAMIETANQALEVAISTIRAGTEVGKIGEAVEEYVKSQGYLPVANLAGHSMDRWILHSRLSIPNIKENNHHKIEEGDVLAIEPFVTDGVGVVGDMKDTFIFRFLRDRPLRLAPARKLLEVIKTKYGNFSFAKRWLMDEPSIMHLNPALRQLVSSRAIYPYHVFREKSGARVAQAEHTVIVEADGCSIMTE
ncbi:MAG: type II methionyl aminopeptidase [Methanobacterium formicicum]|jgi:methionyl aminopeptidase|uniref:Methionine aminopeptidase n=1 Tax=Methanobacterium formicicum TaxID=2162 RepID=A0A089ZFX5_METFO|nr:type II methionyl aminopeptidase [Methanobacterium formicicum]AIS33047.1 methionine aminopeptidase Map2 [Methanobacterium formicicum]MDD4809801.1 type II methionyl aminopeptidase [Methanobacterium formicicum]CEL25896.1 methionine aminopeptidase [Methanobacterium formicicum]